MTAYSAAMQVVHNEADADDIAQMCIRDRDTKGCSSERHIYFWNLIKKLIHSSGNFYKSGSGEQPFVKRKWNRADVYKRQVYCRY